jgi:glutamate transport system permease protein
MMFDKNTAPGVEGTGLLPENLKANTPARHRPNNKGSILFDIPGPKMRKKIAIFNVLGIILLLAIVAHVLNILRINGQLAPEMWTSALSAEAFTHFYLPGLFSTLEVSILAIVVATVFGLLFGSLRLLPSRVVRWTGGSIVEFARAVPVLLLMIFFWRLFSFAGVGDSSSFWAVFISLVLYNGSVIAELVRSGVMNLPRGQREAGLALGFSSVGSLVRIELPQAVKAMIPAMVTQLVVVIKDTALGAIIMYTDLLHEARRLGSANFNMLQTLVVATGIYFIVCFVLSRICERLAEGRK